MLMVMDIGNTNIKTGLFVDGKLKNSWRLQTNHLRTADEYGTMMESFFDHLGISTDVVDGIIMSSVIPSMNYTMEHMCELYFHRRTAMVVNSEMNLGLNIKYDLPSQLGSDRICNSVEAYHRYGGPCVVVDFGTATNFAVISKEGDFLGGLICPGIMVSADALVERAAMLHKVEYVMPEKVIGTNTKEGIQSGLIRGYVGQVDYILQQIEKELGAKPTVVATGGMSGMIANETKRIDIVNPTLTLEGLARIYEMNK
ncbi:MAG: type III pantothenate kinase [Clostridia bacterium]|nr:type III pantothenate kinase [Clostridia bacterium]